MIKGRIIRPDGGESELIPAGAGGQPSLQQLQEAVGGFIELVRTNEHDIVINEEGKLIGLPLNNQATDLARGFISLWDGIVGTAVVYPRGYLQ